MFKLCKTADEQNTIVTHIKTGFFIPANMGYMSAKAQQHVTRISACSWGNSKRKW